MTDGKGGDDIKPPKPAKQLEQYDLCTTPRQNKNKPPISSDPVEYRSPAAMMRQMGFDPTKYMTPLQFLTAVMNDDLDLVFRNKKRRENYEKRGGIGINYRVEAAKTAAKYMHMEMPKVNINEGNDGKFGDELAKSIASGQERVRTKRVILETVERISPDMPIPDASYPPVFDQMQPDRSDHIVDANEMVDHGLNPEGDTEYNPDEE